MGDGADIGERELRIAPVMTGGTSLAVWMGGATAELYRMLCSRHEPARDKGMATYRALLELTATTPRVDVITGTSAGGLNGVLLGVAWSLGVPSEEFMGVRGTWLDVADLEALLRSPREPDPPSLLQGDGYFGPQIEEVLEGWGRQRTPRPDRPVDLVTTVTTLSPDPVSRTDDFDETLNEVTHAHTLRFRSTDGDMDPDRPDSFPRLAVAARTSAGIPGVFEPSFLPVGAKDAHASGRPDFDGRASFVSSRWAVDGGVVVNLPLGEAIDRIFEQRSDQQDVRRVVLYVSPTPSAGRPSVADRASDVPNLRRSLTSIVTAPRAEGIAADVDRIRDKNAQVQRQAQARRVIGPWLEQVLAGPGSPAARRTFERYRAQRARRSLEGMLARLSTRLRDGLPLPTEIIVEGFMAARTSVLPAALELETSTWSWGIAPVEEAGSLVLGLVSRTAGLLRASMDPGQVSAARERLVDARRTVHDAMSMTATVRERDVAFWEARFATLAGALEASGEEDPAWALHELARWAKDSYQRWPDAPTAPAHTEAAEPRPAGTEDWIGSPSLSRLDALHRMVAGALARVAPTIESVAATVAAEDDDGRRAAAEDLLAELGTLCPAGTVIDGTDPSAATIAAVRLRLLQVHVALTLLLLEVEHREQPVELMQLSWNSPNLLDPARSPDDKLAGPELARLGAFVKRSWRANDFCWGRMDAAHRLARLLLDPRRLRQLGAGPTEVLAALDHLGPPPADVTEELDRLSSPGAHVTLPCTVAWVAAALQLVAAQQEVPHVADAVADDARSGANEPDSGRFRQAVEAAGSGTDELPAVAVAGLVQQMRIGTETARSELGYGPLNRAMGRGASVLVNVLSSDTAGIPALPRLLRPLRAPLQGVASLTGVLTDGSPLARGLTAFILAAAGAVLALGILDAPVSGAAVAVAGVLFAGTVLVAMLRSGVVWLATGAAAGAAVIALALVGGDDLRPVLYDTTTPAPALEGLPAGTVVRAPGGMVVRTEVGEGDDARVVDVAFDDAGRLVLRGDGAAIEARPARPTDPAWKRWGFLNELSIARVLLAALVVDAAVRTWRRWPNYRTGRRIRRVAGLAAGAALTAAVPWLAERALTGADPGSDGGGAKARLVRLADGLHDYELGVVLAVLVGTAVLIGLGTDLVVSRWFRRSWPRAARST